MVKSIRLTNSNQVINEEKQLKTGTYIHFATACGDVKIWKNKH